MSCMLPESQGCVSWVCRVRQERARIPSRSRCRALRKLFFQGCKEVQSVPALHKWSRLVPRCSALFQLIMYLYVTFASGMSLQVYFVMAHHTIYHPQWKKKIENSYAFHSPKQISWRESDVGDKAKRIIEKIFDQTSCFTLCLRKGSFSLSQIKWWPRTDLKHANAGLKSRLAPCQFSFV